MSRKQLLSIATIFMLFASAVLKRFDLELIDDESILSITIIAVAWVAARSKKDKKLRKSRKGRAKKWTAGDFVLVIAGIIAIIVNAIFKIGMPPVAISAFCSTSSGLWKIKDIKDEN